MNSRQWDPTNVLVFLIKFDSIAALLWHKCYFVCKNRNFSSFPLQKRKIAYLCLAKPGEIGWPEKAHSSLCSSAVNLDNSHEL